MIQWMLGIWSLVPLPFLKSNLNIWKFSVRVLLKPNLENFEHYFTSMWNECNCAVVWRGFPGSSAGKESTSNAGDPGSIPGSGRSTEEGIGYSLQYSWVSLVTQLVKNLPAMQETWVRSLSQEDPLEKGKATHSSILAWRIPWTYSPWSHRESDTTERFSLSFITIIGALLNVGVNKRTPQPTCEVPDTSYNTRA